MNRAVKQKNRILGFDSIERCFAIRRHQSVVGQENTGRRDHRFGCRAERSNVSFCIFRNSRQSDDIDYRGRRLGNNLFHRIILPDDDLLRLVDDGHMFGGLLEKIPLGKVLAGSQTRHERAFEKHPAYPAQNQDQKG